MSTIGKHYHKGEFKSNAIAVFFLRGFQKGCDISNGNLNLGIYEFTCVLHYQVIKSNYNGAMFCPECIMR
jgi:hypothetical protein